MSFYRDSVGLWWYLVLIDDTLSAEAFQCLTDEFIRGKLGRNLAELIQKISWDLKRSIAALSTRFNVLLVFSGRFQLNKTLSLSNGLLRPLTKLHSCVGLLQADYWLMEIKSCIVRKTLNAVLLSSSSFYPVVSPDTVLLSDDDTLWELKKYIQLFQVI